jgi:hypothetical protein
MHLRKQIEGNIMSKLRYLKLYYSAFGRNVNQQKSITLLYRHPDAMEVSDIKDIHTKVAAAVATILVPQCKILRVTSSLYRRKGDPRIIRGSAIRSTPKLSGTRPNADNKHIGLMNQVAIFIKEDEKGGDGDISVRGAFLTGEVISVDGEPQLAAGFVSAPFTAFGAALIAAFEGEGAELVLPAPKSENAITGARPVKTIVFQGVGELQETSKKRSPLQEKRAYVDGLLQDLEEEYRQATTNEDGSRFVPAPEVVAAIAAKLVPLIEGQGLPFLSSRGMYKKIPLTVITAALAIITAKAQNNKPDVT